MTALVAAYDAHDGSWWGLTEINRQRFKEWAKLEGCDLDDHAVYRTEIHGVENAFIRVFAFALDEQGRKYVDPATDDVAKREPYDVPISSMPPV